MRKQIYLAIAGRIQSSGLKVPYFDLWNENIQFVAKGRLFQTPAVFVEFEPVTWRQMGMQAKEADINIRLHIVTQTKGETAFHSKYREEELNALQLTEEIAAVIPGLSGDGFGSFIHIGTIPDHNHDELVHNIEVYRTHVIDRSAAKTTTILTGSVELKTGRN